MTAWIEPDRDGYRVEIPRTHSTVSRWDGGLVQAERDALFAWMKDRSIEFKNVEFWDSGERGRTFRIYVPQFSHAVIVYLGLMDGVPDVAH